MNPYRIYLEVTRSCPLQCLHCYAEDSSGLYDELTLQDFERLANQMISMKIKELIISGGEPFLRPDIFQLIEIASRRGLNVTVLTNGVLINQQMAQAIKNFNIDLRLSLDGITSETHDFVRGKGNLEKVIEAIEIIKKEGIKILSIHFTANRMNIPEILRLPNFLFHLGITNITISTIKPAGRALRHPELLIGPDLMLLVRDRINTISKSRNLIFQAYKEKNWRGLGCPAAYTKCGISNDGQITPCVFLGDNYRGGSIRESPLEDLWLNDEKLNQIRNIPANIPCSNCSALPFQNGGCRARALYYSGSINGKDPFCCELKKHSENLSSLRISDILNDSNGKLTISNHDRSSPGKDEHQKDIFVT